MKASVARRLGWLWLPYLYAGVILGFLLGKAVPGTQVAPFGIAFYAAVRGAGFKGPEALPVAVAVIAGSLGFDALVLLRAPWVVLAVLLSHLLAPLFRAERASPSPLGAAVLASVSVALPVAALYGRSDPVPSVLLVGLTGVMALVFTLGIADAVSGKLGHLPGDSPVPAIILVAAALCGLEGIQPVAGIALRDLAAGLVVMSCAYVGGAPLGAAGGAVLGITFLITAFGGNQAFFPGLTNPEGATAGAQGMAYVVAGMLAGTFRELRKGGVGLAFLLGFTIYAMASLQDSERLLTLAMSSGTAAILFWLVPRAWLSALPASMGPSAPVALPPEPVHAPPAGSALAEKVAGISRVFKEVSRTFEQAAVVADAPEQPRTQSAFEPAAERVCTSCSLYRQCWEKDLTKTYQVFTDVWNRIEEDGPLGTHNMSSDLERHCIRPAEVLAALNYLHDTRRSSAHWERKLDEGRSVVVDYLRNISRMLDRFVEEIDTTSGRTRAEAPPVLKAVSGVARVPKRGSHISGDSYAGEALDEGRYMLALSDGMGVGKAAALESRQCVSLLREILRAGFASEVAVKTVNSALLLHSTEESFATVDLALLDLTSGRAEFVKVGAAPSFIKRGDDVTVIKTASVPVGIINQVQVEPEFRTLRPGDILVMITDGVWDLSKDDVDKERWLISHLERETAEDPEEIAESILARAIELLPNAGDDLTVLVARLDAVRGFSLQPERRQTGTWAPVRRAPKLEARSPRGAK